MNSKFPHRKAFNSPLTTSQRPRRQIKAEERLDLNLNLVAISLELVTSLLVRRHCRISPGEVLGYHVCVLTQAKYCVELLVSSHAMIQFFHRSF